MKMSQLHKTQNDDGMGLLLAVEFHHASLVMRSITAANAYLFIQNLTMKMLTEWMMMLSWRVDLFATMVVSTVSESCHNKMKRTSRQHGPILAKSTFTT